VYENRLHLKAILATTQDYLVYAIKKPPAREPGLSAGGFEDELSVGGR